MPEKGGRVLAVPVNGVVDAPVVPLLPSGPNRPLYLVGVFLAALAAGRDARGAGSLPGGPEAR